MQKLIDVLDIELQVTERLYMCYDSYNRDDYESAMGDQFYYLYAVDKFENAMKQLTPDEVMHYVGLREFKLEFLND